ncbi:bacteriohopanetetrol glucosamine biosynthesis glycosyltransferase HpnI [Geminocystis herdmanii]|uniref:bacteriohopanetetrol glucosamine biosynthesis glycosyltransferase HpnI n=1 Tax=Geminocystis herdmanii TaxID=669359 RepID=UPI00034D1879|nr:bacteriohopanetetrol glucosamine biosynthesis glycosyltransferase HpnI [Geminocystis herdmanii]
MLNLLSIIFLILTLGSIVYYLYSLYSCHSFFSLENKINPDFSPPISILKPLWGLETNLEENLTSFINQNYPLYQIVFCVRDKDDPVIFLVEELIVKYSQQDLKLVVIDRVIGYNYKVSNLANGFPYCDYDLILIADSDIEVKKDYLSTIVQPLQDEKVGVVTCLYQSFADNYIGIIESLGVAYNFIPNVLTARQLEGINFAFGSSILIRKKVLEKIGNFQRIANSLADDFLLGNLPTKLGYQTVLVNYIVKHHIEKESFDNYFKRQIRWFRCIKVARFKGYLGMIFTFGIVNSFIFSIVLYFNVLSLSLLLITFFLKLILSYNIGFKYLKNITIKNYLGLVVVVDFMQFYIWLIALFGNKIKWKNSQFILNQKGELIFLK